MELREITGITLSIWQDHVMDTSFVNILTEAELFSAKLPSTITRYKLAHLINPEYLLDFELVKTRKNWIIKNIVIRKRIAQPGSYDEHTIFAEMIKTIQKLTHSDQQTNSLSVLLRFLQHPLSKIKLSDFENALLHAEGFTEHNQELL